MSSAIIDQEFRLRFWRQEESRSGDTRDEYQRDRARIIHSAAFRRLQAKTQVMGIGEGDFHRTRLTHSIEVGQIGEGILSHLRHRYRENKEITEWLPSNDLVLSSCYAHDLGHPPFGHGGEKALHLRMAEKGGFEGNGQTLRILTRLEKYRLHEGINPSRRLILAVLKYPTPYSRFDIDRHRTKPPKCYFDTECEIISWALEPFTSDERDVFTKTLTDGKPEHRSLDAMLMECADDIAYGVHDIEDIIARRLASPDDIWEEVKALLNKTGDAAEVSAYGISLDDFMDGLFGGDSCKRKQLIGKLVNLFVTSTEIVEENHFSHPLLRYRVTIPTEVNKLLEALKTMAFELVISRPEIQQLERRGQRIIDSLFEEFIKAPERLIPKDSWNGLNSNDSDDRRVCDYIAGMTDPFAEKIYKRLFMPGFGSSRDEL